MKKRQPSKTPHTKSWPPASGKIPRRPPRRQPPREADWLCSRCGQVSNSSEPCYDCARKERDANPIPPPPPVLCGPTRDSSRKSYKREQRQPSNTLYTKSSPRKRPQPSKTPYTRGWPIPQKPDPNITPTRRCDFGAFDFVRRFINWLRIAILPSEVWTSIDKPKHKPNGEQMDSISDLFEGYDVGVDWGNHEDRTVIHVLDENGNLVEYKEDTE